MKYNQLQKAIIKADNELKKEAHRQILMVHGAAAVALKNKWKYSRDKINEVFNASDRVWHEIGDDNKVSMIAKLEDETGIEMRLTDSPQSWHELAFLNDSGDYMDGITGYQFLAMRKKQTKWMGAMIQASLYLALAREFKWGPIKLRNLMDEIGRIREEQHQKEQSILDLCRNETGIDCIKRFCRGY